MFASEALRCHLLAAAFLAAAAEVVDVTWGWPSARRLASPAFGARLDEAASGEELHVAFDADGASFQLTLRRNRGLLSGGIRHHIMGAGGQVEEGPLPRSCYYVGHAQGDPESRSGLSTCSGALSGMVLAHGRALAIEPLKGAVGADGKMPHVVRRMEGEEVLRKRAAVAKFMRGDLGDGEARRLAGSAKKTVEILLATDHERFLAFGGASSSSALVEHSVGIINAAAAMYRAPPGDNASFSYDIELAVVDIVTFPDKDPWEETVETQGDKVLAESLLSQFGSWGQSQLVAGRVGAHDNRILISGRQFDGSAAGLAFIGTMCKHSYSSSIGQCLGTAADDLGMCGAIVAHELGHNLGMRHDGEDNACKPDVNVMAPSTIASADRFSSCSTKYVADFFTKQYTKIGACLENSPVAVLGDPVCGNGFIEEGEDCDCGQANCSGIDACCGTNCTFAKPSYQCGSSAGPCCEECMFVGSDAKKVCRESRGACDMAEYCGGGSSECAPGRYKFPGRACAEDGVGGVCFEGSCSSLQTTCARDITANFPGSWDSSEGCARHNDKCGHLVCHRKGEEENSCGQAFEVHGKQLAVPDGTPCLFDGGRRSERQGMCFDSTCVSPHSLALAPFCGNGGIDVGEQCDCGETDDPCCDCDACTLKPGSECSSHEPCCTDQCALRPKNETCREAIGDCDVAEVCSGNSGHCPPDVGMVWGSPCEHSSEDGRKTRSTCYGKVCLPSLDHQCKSQTQGVRPFSMKTVEGAPDEGHRCTALACCTLCTQLDGEFDFNGKLVKNPIDCQDCGVNEKTSKYVLGGETHTLWLTAPVDGAVLSEPSEVCIGGERVMGIASQDECPEMRYWEAAVGKCVPCDPGCQVGCFGPTNLDCRGRCRFGVDKRGACASTELQASSPQVVNDTRVFPDPDTAMADGASTRGGLVGVLTALLAAVLSRS